MSDEVNRYRAAVSLARGPRVEYRLQIYLPGGGDIVESGRIPASAVAEALRRHARALDDLVNRDG